jgi:hypothetical protein
VSLEEAIPPKILFNFFVNFPSNRLTAQCNMRII